MSSNVADLPPKLPYTAENIINSLDNNFLEELGKLRLTPGPQDPLDHAGAREWLEMVYRPLPKTPKPIRYVRNPTTVSVHDVMVTYGCQEEFKIRVYNPQTPGQRESMLLPAVLAYHGGGWIHGYSELDDDIYMFMASETQSVVFGIDYRLAPEHRFPVPHNDSYEALNYVIANPEKYGIDITRIALWGASAGGNLAAGVALRDAQEHNPTRIRHVSLVVPALCPPSLAPAILSEPSASYPHFTSQSSALALKDVEKLWETYANGRENLSNPYVAPLLSAPAYNHCPMHVVVAGADVLRDEGIAYAVMYRNMGSDVQLEVIPGAPHGLTAAAEAWSSRQYWTNQVRILNVALNTAF